METNGKGGRRTTTETKLPLVQDKQSCDFNGYDADVLSYIVKCKSHTFSDELMSILIVTYFFLIRVLILNRSNIDR
jgi:hypothetical protein